MLLLSVWAFAPQEKYFEIAKNLDIFATLFQEVNKSYVDEVSPSDLMKTGINAMLSKLDPYTNYIPEDRIEDYRTMTTGEYGGIGAVVGQRNGKVTVIMPNAGYAADKAGLRIGDQIISIDGVEITEDNMYDISKFLKVEAGPDNSLQVKRYGEPKPLTFSFEREKIKLDNVPYYGMVTEDVGLIQLTDFTQNASKEVKNALVELKDQGAEKIILDLRGNPGGLLREAINISNVFVEKGLEIVSTKGKVKDWNRSHVALRPATDTDIPLAVLINRSSASASEIVSGVMQDYDRGVLIGQRTFGKGLVQATRSLSYNSKLKVTVAKYYIPSGRCIQELDYSHRKLDGSVDKIPDSLRMEFKTRNGRVVYDGGGVAPDIEAKRPDLSPITRSLINKGLLFEYSVVYRNTHDQIPPAKEFDISDQDFKEFEAWLSNKDYDYSTPTEELLTRLKDASQEEDRYDDIKKEIYSLSDKIQHDKKQDLKKFRKEICEELEKEILAQYYFKKGELEASFDDNGEILSAVEVLNNPSKYKRILEDQ